jgi:glycosyltransferase involved in cell wall biosynthesis
MKIGFITPFFSPVAGGSATAPYYLAKYLVRKGHEVFVFTSNFGRNLAKFADEKDLAIIESRIVLKMFNLFYTPSLRSKLESCNKLDIVHFHNFRTYQNYVAYNYVKRTNTPYILQARGSLPRIGKKELKWVYDAFFGYRLLRGASKVIALTKVEAEQYRSMGVSEGKIAIIPNGIDLSEYTELPLKGSFKKKFNIPEDRKIILYLGRIHKIKGIDFLVRAYAYLKNEVKCKDTVLVIAGPDDGFLDEVKSLVQSLGISRFVIFTGPLYGKEKLGAYVDSDIVVLPSRYETFPNVVLEAYACSKPVVASNVEAIPDIVLHGETGLLFQASDVKELANAIAYMLTHSEEAERMGRDARRLVEEKFSIDRVVTQLEALYEKVLKDEQGKQVI